MKLAIRSMNPQDLFQVIKFSMDAEGFAPGPVPNTPDNVKRAMEYVGAMAGEGGTMMVEGIKAALDYPREPKRRRVVLFMTDGYIGNEDEILAAIQDRLGNARLFSFGVGSSVNRYLLEKMAQVGRGQVTYCRPDEDPEPKVKLFQERIAKPYLLDIEVDWHGLATDEVFPECIPDLFSAQPVVIHGRFTKPGQATVLVKGTVAGKPVVQEIPVVFPADQKENDVIATLWARTKIERLMNDMFRGEDSTKVAQVTELALKFNIMSKYTSFVAVEEQVRNIGGKLETVQVPIPIPEGVSYEGVFGERDEARGGMMGSPGMGRAPAVSFSREARPADKKTVVVAPRVEFRKLSILGALDSPAVTETLEANRSRLEKLCADRRSANPGFAGEVVVWLTVRPNGTVESVVIKSSALQDKVFEKILRRELKRWHFSAPTDGGRATVNVTVVIK